MGGTVTARSRLGVGTTVTFTVPAAAATLARRDPVPDDGTRLAGKRVLIVDGHATSRRLLGELLLAWGMRVADTSSPAAALRWIGEGRRFDVVLLDQGGRDSDGAAYSGVVLADAVHATPGGAAVAIVLLTSVGRVPAPGLPVFAAVLTTPLRPATIFRALAAALPDPTRPAPTVGEAHTGAALRILVADDHPVNQRLVLLQLAQLGHHADLVSNGAEAVTAIRRRPFDVVLMDVRMPELDGPAATRLIHAELGARSTWIIAVTADALPGTQDACLAAGMNDFLTKPLVAADLARALARAAEGTRSGRSGDRPVLDPDALDTLRELVGGDPSALSGLVAEFLAETPPAGSRRRGAYRVAGDEADVRHDQIGGETVTLTGEALVRWKYQLHAGLPRDGAVG